MSPLHLEILTDTVAQARQTLEQAQENIRYGLKLTEVARLIALGIAADSSPRQYTAEPSSQSPTAHAPEAYTTLQGEAQKSPPESPKSDSSPHLRPAESSQPREDIPSSSPSNCGCGKLNQIPEHIRAGHTALIADLLGALSETPLLPFRDGDSERRLNPLSIAAVLEIPFREICPHCFRAQEGKGAA